MRPWIVAGAILNLGAGLVIASGRLDGSGSPPVSLFAPAGEPSALVIHLTGDAGIAPADRAMARRWIATGARVVVLNTLRYFLTERPPSRQARDLAGLVATHGWTSGGVPLPVVLSGFSFGADALPFAYPLLPSDVGNRVVRIALISPTPRIAFHSLSGWMKGIHDVAAAIGALPSEKVICVAGDQDDKNACRDPRLRDLDVRTVAGKHRLTAPPENVADIVVEGIPENGGPTGLEPSLVQALHSPFTRPRRAREGAPGCGPRAEHHPPGGGRWSMSSMAARPPGKRSPACCKAPVTT